MASYLLIEGLFEVKDHCFASSLEGAIAHFSVKGYINRNNVQERNEFIQSARFILEGIVRDVEKQTEATNFGNIFTEVMEEHNE